jgi:AcrR family transcriptional regulator
MARPTVIDDDLILTTAREVFLEKGQRATTADIAERAGVSQGILFKRFKTKQALFKASMNLEEYEDSPLPVNLQAKIGVGSVKENLRELGNALVHKFLGLVPSMMMNWSNSREEAAAKNCEQASERGVRRIHMISCYLEEEARLGRIKGVNPEILAQTFVGALWHYAFLQVMMGEVHKEPITQEQYVDGVVNTLWCGISPTDC